MIRISRLLALILGLAVVVGCSDDPIAEPESDQDPYPTDNYPIALTPHLLIDNFVRAYQDSVVFDYREQLSMDFKFVLTEDRGDLNYSEEVRIQELMSAGEAGVDGIAFEEILVDACVGTEVWQAVPASDHDFSDYHGNAWYRPHHIDISFQVDGLSLTYRVQGTVIFYVTLEEVDGVVVYKLLGMVDQTNTKGDEARTWSDIRMIFRPTITAP